VVKQEIDTPPLAPVGDLPPGDEASGVALPVPSDADGNGKPPVEGIGRHDAGAAGTDDGLPSFEDGEAAASPCGSGEGLPGAASPPGTPSPALGDCDSLPVTGVPVTGIQPHGVVSPPATTVFGGGIGGAPTGEDDDDGSAAASHRVPLTDSEDLGASASANAGTVGAATAQERGAAPSQADDEVALQ
jgi:hypothetical protein